MAQYLKREINQRYYNKDQDPENYFREQLMLFYPWRKEKEDLLGAFDNYENHYNEKN